MVNYSFFFWLPFYLTNNFHWSEEDSDALSVWYDWGGIAGGVLGGIVSDHLASRSPVLVAMLLCATGSLLGYSSA